MNNYELLLPDTAELKKYVKVNADFPEGNWQPYLDDAADSYLRPYLGEALLAVISEQLPATSDQQPATNEQQATSSEEALEKLRELVKKPLAIFTMFVCADENAVHIGDQGMVEATAEHFAQAGKDKVFAYKKNLARRGWQALETLLQYLEENAEDYPEWEPKTDLYLNSAREFQDLGRVNIGYSRLTFEWLRSYMMAVESKDVMQLIGIEMDTALRIRATSDQPSATNGNAQLLLLVQRYVANKAAELATNTSPKQSPLSPKGGNAVFEFEPNIARIGTGLGDNYYKGQADYYYAKIVEAIGTGETEDDNAADKKIFVA